MAVEQLLDLLHAVKRTGPTSWVACCPAHADQRPSLSIGETEKGLILLNCFAGCATADVMGAIGLSLGDLFPDGPKAHLFHPSRQHSPAADILHCLAFEARIVALAAADIADGEILSDHDLERLNLAVIRLEQAAREAHS